MQFFLDPNHLLLHPILKHPFLTWEGAGKEMQNSALQSNSTIWSLSEALGHIVLRDESIRGKSCSMPLENPRKSHPPAALGCVGNFILPVPRGQEGQRTMQEEQPSRLRATCLAKRTGSTAAEKRKNPKPSKWGNIVIRRRGNPLCRTWSI